MAQEAMWWAPHDDGFTVAVRVTPGARRSEVVPGPPEQLRVRVGAPAVEGKANAELQRFLARHFGVRRSAVSVLRGDRSRDKVVLITGLPAPPAGSGPG